MVSVLWVEGRPGENLRANSELEEEVIVDSLEARVCDGCPDASCTGEGIEGAAEERGGPCVGGRICCNALLRDAVVERDVVVVCPCQGESASEELT